MIRGRRCIGIALAALGLGLILSVLFEGCLLPLLLGLVLIAAGCLFMKCC